MEVQIPSFGGQTTAGSVATSYPFGMNQDVQNVVSATAAAIATGGTITSLGVSVARVAPTAAVTGVILEPGVFDGQMVTVSNEAAAGNSVTFAAAGTSNVAAGTSAVVAGNAKLILMWSKSLALWL